MRICSNPPDGSTIRGRVPIRILPLEAGAGEEVGLAILGLFLLALAALALSTYLGYGLVKLLRPADRRDDEGLLAPLLGYAFLLLIGYYGVTTVLNLRQVLLIALGSGTLLNALALWRCRDRRLHLDLREHGGALLLAGLAFLLGILPLLHYGYVTVIGENWDPEFYLPVAEYLLRVPIRGIASMPPSPLRDLSADPARIALTPGFTIAQASWQQLVGQDALRSFAPTLALLRAFGVLATYLLFRRTLGMARRAALLATALAALYALSLWLTFFNFGIQLASLPLVPLGLALLADLLRHPSWGEAVATGLAVAAIPVAYYPALTAFLPMAGALALAELLLARRRRPVLLAGCGAALCTLLLAWGPILAYGQGFAERYAQTKVMLWLNRLITWPEALGLAPLATSPAAGPPDALLWAALLLLLLLSLPALIRSRFRWPWLALAASGLLYLIWLRGLLGQMLSILPLPPALSEALQPYPYAYMKGTVYVAPLLLGLAVQGLAELPALCSGRGRRILAGGAVAVVLFLLALAGRSAGQVIARYWERPALYGRETLEVEEAVALLPPEAAVYLTDHLDHIGPETGILAYLLRDHPLRGTVAGAYDGMAYCLPGEAFPYALLDRNDNPYLLGLFPEDRIWQGSRMALYRRNPEQRAFLDLRTGACPGTDARPALASSPLAAQLLAAPGACREVSPERPLRLYATASTLTLEAPAEGTAEVRSVSLLLAWAGREEIEAHLRWDDGEGETRILPAGFSLYRATPHPVPAQLEISSTRPAQLCWVALTEGEGTPGEISLPRTALLSPEAEVRGTSLELRLETAQAVSRTLSGAIEVWENAYGDAVHYARWGPLALPPGEKVVLRMDLATREAYLGEGPDVHPLPLAGGPEAWPPAGDGEYFASLWVDYGGRTVATVPLAVFRVAGGKIGDLAAFPLSPIPLYFRPSATPTDVRYGEVLDLLACEQSTQTLSPGETLHLTLEWRSRLPIARPYVVTAQLLGPDRLYGQVDLPVGGEQHPTPLWKPGEEVADGLPLKVDPATPPGRYRLIVAVYDPASGVRLPVRSPDGKTLGDFLDLGEVEVR